MTVVEKSFVKCVKSAKTHTRSTHKVLVVVVGEEQLQSWGPVVSAPQETRDVPAAAHVAVPGVLEDSGLCGSGPHEQIDTLHAEAPTQTQR